MRALRNAGFAVLCASWISASSAEVVRQATDRLTTRTTVGAVDAAGIMAYSISDADPFGTNPGHVPQVFKWDLSSGVGEQITAFPDGVDADFANGYGPSVSDDGQKVVFLLDGRIAMVDADGSGLVQLTTTLATIHHVQIAGNASRVVFDSPANLTGENPGGIVQVFVVEADGTGLRQLTSHTTNWAWTAWPSISDDGQRIAFLTTEGSVDGLPQIAGIFQDGSGLHWITNVSNLQPGWKQLSGNGQSVAFQACGSLAPPVGGCPGACQVVLVEWDGTGLKPLDAPCDGNLAPGWAGAPDITDDASTIYYAARNFGNYEIWKIRRDRTGWTELTNTRLQPPPQATCWSFARVAGGGSRFTFDCFGGEPWGGPNPDLSNELYAADGNGTGHHQLSNTLAGDSTEPDITAGGGRIVFVSSANPLGETGIVGTQLYRVTPGGSDLARITSLVDASTAEPSVSDDGIWIAFTRREKSRYDRVFTVRDDGSTLTAIAPGSYARDTNTPHIASDGSFVVFASGADLLGEGLPEGARIYRANRDGSGLVRVSAAATDLSEHPRLDATRTWVAYARAGKIRRTRLDGTVDQQVTTLGASDRPEPTPGAGLIVYQSTGNPLGTNADVNTEIFLWDAGTGATRQLTATSVGHNLSPRISRDGQWVTFWSDAEFFGSTYTEGEFEPHRIEVSTGLIERIGGLAACAAEFVYSGVDEPAPVALEQAGALAAHGWPGDCAGANRDLSAELFVVDWLAVPRLSVSPGPAPTVVTWDVEPGPVRYDVVRGDVASLGFRGDGSVDLGDVLCVEDDSVDASTDAAPDPDTPMPGRVLFYLYRGSPGPLAGSGSYGRSSGGGERTPTTGDCPG